MAIKYDYYPNPPQGGDGEKPTLHPRPVISGTLKTDYLAEAMSASSSFTPGDIRGVLDNLVYQIRIGLSTSQNVHLEGLGTFSISLESRPVKDRSEIRSSSIRIKDIHFRPDKKLKNMLNQATIQRVKYPHNRLSFTPEIRLERIRWYIHRYEGINITTVMRLNHCNHKKAMADIQKMTDAGEIKQKHYGSTIIYTFK